MTRIASHRGGSLQWPENSPTAFRNTARLPVDQVEFDIHPTADGEIVVIHDATLDRTTAATGPVAGRSLAELKAIPLNGTENESLFTLDELLALFAPTPITLRMEVKYDIAHRRYPGLVAAALARLDRHGLRARTVVTSFQRDTVAEAAAAGIRAVSIRIPRLDAELIARLRPLNVGAYAVNTEADIRKALALGVDVFTTDVPSLALKIRDATP